MIQISLSLVDKWGKEGISAALGVHIFSLITGNNKSCRETARIKCLIQINAYKIPKIYKLCISSEFH